MTSRWLAACRRATRVAYRRPSRAAGSRPTRVAYRRTTLAARIALVTCAVAGLAVLATAAVAIPVAARTANREARETLDREASLVASLLVVGEADDQELIHRLSGTGIEIYQISGSGPGPRGVPDRIVTAVRAGLAVPARVAVVLGRARLVAAQPIPGRPGTGVLLTTEPMTGVGRAVWDRLWLALLAGLVAGLAAGPPLARRIVRPLDGAAAAARRLTAGDRAVRLPTDGPAETADLALAINRLAEALAISEGQQREFLLSVSHDLRTPLTAIRGYAEALADGVIEAAELTDVGRVVASEAQRLERLVADLLVLARLEAADLPIEPVQIDLCQLLVDAGEAWRQRGVAAGVVLRTELPGEPVPVPADPGRLRQIVDALVENALRVVPPGAPIVLAARPGPAGWAIAEVRDGGPGLDDDDLRVAFERGALYQRYRGVRAVGSGLGLAIVARLARRLGGRIEAGHAAEGGARFTLSLPT